MSEIDTVSRVYVLSSQNGLPYKTIASLKEIPGLTPDYIVIASPTDQHYSQLKFLNEHLESRKILVEKPLFDIYHDFTIKNNQVFVGYNLRFHPMINKIKNFCKNKQLWNIQVFCGSYLPDWRADRDYRKTSSARQDSGGGVLLDLSHELDYVQWLAGPLELKETVSEKVSDLEIDSDDLLLLSGKTKGGAHIHISLNYFTRQPIRQILLDGERISIQGDLISNTLSVVKDGEIYDFSWAEHESDDTYRAQHRAILEGDFKKICSFEEGLETMCLIENIRKWRN